MIRFLALLSLSRHVICSSGDGDSDYAWGGMFEVADDEDYIWVAQKVEGAYAASNIMFVMVPTNTTDEDDFEAAQGEADPLFEPGAALGCILKAAGSTLTPSASGASCFNLTLEAEDEDYESKWFLGTSGVLPAAGKTGLAIFTDREPGLFEATSHYLRDEEGHDVEAVHATDEEDHHDDEDHHDEESTVGEVLLACFIVNLLTLAGVALLGLNVVAPLVRPKSQKPADGEGGDPSGQLASPTSPMSSSPLLGGALHGFAAGALLACAAFLMAVESSHMIEGEAWVDDEEAAEVAATWRWGTMVLAGFLAPLCLHLVADFLGFDAVALLKTPLGGSAATIDDKKNCSPCEQVTVAPNPSKTPGSDAVDRGTSLDLEASTKVTAAAGSGGEGGSIIFAVCVGDFMHNFTDGVLIGTAFQLCSHGMAWSMVAAACGHELAQELADYVILTSAPLALPPFHALALNFSIGLAVILGGLLVSAVNFAEGTLGLILAFGAGTYIYLGATVSLPAALRARRSPDAPGERNHTALVILAFVLGAVAIGLILMDHAHCEEGHGHGDEHGDEEEEDAHGH